jgi:signal transduction histidine kinase
MAPGSLRSRLVVGSLLWTVGLVGAVNLATLFLVHRMRSVGHIHLALMTVIAIGLLAAGLMQVRSGMAPLLRLRARLAAMRNGTARRVEGDYPAEVQPLVDDLNALLDDREERVGRALAKAGDLAHGLKTPLAVMTREAERVAEGGDDELSGTLSEQIDGMRRQIEFHLALARAAASRATPDARCRVRDSADGVVRALMRLHAGRGLSIHVDVPGEQMALVHRADLDEMLGNLLDNACKWARSQVAVTSTLADGMLSVTVDDDGPGLEPALRDKVLERGVRADEAAPGSGFGLAIVREVAEVYGGRVALERSPQGGVRARLSLPAAGDGVRA